MTDQPDLKRARLETPNKHQIAITDQSDLKRARLEAPISPLLRYPFVKHVLLPMLDDNDVLNRLVITGKSVVEWLEWYDVKRCVAYKKAVQLVTADRFVPLSIRSINRADSYDFECLPDLHTIKFDNYFDEELFEGYLPETLRELDFGKEFNQVIEEGCIPQSVEILTFGEAFDQDLVPGDIPLGVKRLNFTHCCLDGMFDSPLAEGVIPSSVLYLRMSAMFNQLLNPGILPSSLIELELGDHFNQPLIIGSLPNSLLRLSIGSSFSHYLAPGVLPASLIYLALDRYNHHILPGCLPPSLTEFELGRTCEYMGLVKELRHCQSLKKLGLSLGVKFSDVRCVFPAGLTHLRLTEGFNAPIHPNSLPNSITHLLFGANFNTPLAVGSLPPALLHLEFGDAFNQMIMPGVLPSTLVKLGFGKGFCQAIPFSTIPPSVKLLRLHKLVLIPWFPPTITHLTLHMEQQQLFPGLISFMYNLTNLTLVKCKMFSADMIPPSVTHLQFALDHFMPSGESIPPTVQYLGLPKLLGYKYRDHDRVNAQISYHADCDFDDFDSWYDPIWYDPTDPNSFQFKVNVLDSDY